MTGPTKPQPRGGPVAREIWRQLCLTNREPPTFRRPSLDLWVWLGAFLAEYVLGEVEWLSPVAFLRESDAWGTHHMLIEALKQAKAENV